MPARPIVQCPPSERVLQRELDEARSAYHGGDLGEGTRALNVKRRRVGKRWMVEEVEELGAEAQALAFRQLENLGQSEVQVFLWRAVNAVARSVTVNRSIARVAVGKRNHRVRNVGGNVCPVSEPRLDASMGGRGRATGTRRKC